MGGTVPGNTPISSSASFVPATFCLDTTEAKTVCTPHDREANDQKGACSTPVATEDDGPAISITIGRTDDDCLSTYYLWIFPFQRAGTDKMF